ncbi:MAG: VCBS repeat-containing protein [Bacteroidales bacterium]|nr:VCBS repeat-containing protein [Bacteroidales bacterium]
MRHIGSVLLTLAFSFILVKGQINNNFNVLSYPAVYEADSDWGDYNNDGKIDVLVSGALQGGYPITRIYRNDGGNTFTYEEKAQFKGLSKCAVKWGDYNRDGYLDLAVSGQDTLLNRFSRIYRNNGDSTFTWLDQLELTAFANGSVGWSDIDRDGDLDLFLTGDALVVGRVFRIYENLGDDQFAEIAGHNLPGISYGDIDFTDLNGDGFPDIALAGYSMNNPVADIYLNAGDKSFTPLSAGLKQTQYASIEFSDYDRDGDFDLLQSGQADSIGIWLYINTDNSFEMDSFTNFGVARGDICWGEYDNDGYPDVLIGGMDKYFTYHGEVFKNNQDGTFTRQPDFINDFIYGSIDWADYSNDGDMDAFVAGSNFGRMFVNNIVVKNADPLPPLNLNAELGDTAITFTWSPATDDLTPEGSLTYNIILGVVGDTGKMVHPHADFHTGFLKTVEHGNAGMDTVFVFPKPLSGSYIWSVQTVDNGFRGSEFAGFQTLNIAVNPPTIQTSQLTIAANSADSTLIRFTTGDGEQRIVFMAEGTVEPAIPMDDTHYTADNSFGNGSAIDGSGFYCVYAGQDDSVVVSNLVANESYSVVVMEVNGSMGMEKYLTSLSTENSLEFKTDLFNTYVPASIPATFNGKNLWADLDNDDDMDLLTYGSQALFGTRLSVYLNTENEFPEKEDAGLPAFMDGDFAIADLDGDNDADILISGATDDEYAQIFLNDGASNFSRLEGVEIPATVYGEIAILDYDRDGRMDVILTGMNTTAGERTTKLFRNLGGGVFGENQQVDFSQLSQSTISLCDVNSDGFTDLLLSGEATDNVPLTELYINQGGESFERITDSGIDNFLEGKSDWADMDEDGDPDLIITGLIALEPQVRKSCIYQNDGNGNFSEYLNLTDREISNGDVKWTDFNQDGLVDIILSGEQAFDQRTAAFYAQNDDHSFTLDESVQVMPLDWTSAAVADYDKDGDQDVFLSGLIAQNTPVCYIMENKTTKTNLPPSVPDGLEYTQEDVKMTLSWEPATDDLNSGNGINYHVYIRADGSDTYIVSPLAGVSGFQKLCNQHNTGSALNYFIIDSLTPGTYSWGVQSVDASGRYSDFSVESSFVRKHLQSIQFDSISPVNYGSESFALSTESNFGLEIALTSSDEAIALVGPDRMLEPQLAGICTITAEQAGNDTILAAVPVSRIMQVNPVLPEVSTLSYDLLDYDDILVFGRVISHGGEPDAVRGLCHNYNRNPDLSDHVITLGTGEGNFEDTIYPTEIEIGSGIYFRSFVTNSLGTAYGEEFHIIFSDLNTLSNTEPVIYPNPGQGLLNILYSQSFRGGVLRITDINHRVVYIQDLEASDRSPINISHLTSGIYFISIESQGGSIHHAKYLLTGRE